MYICNKCGVRLDSGETCSCGGRAVCNTWQPGYSAGRRRKNKATPKKKYEKKIVYEIYERGCGEVIREYTDFNLASISCGSDEYLQTTMILTPVN